MLEEQLFMHNHVVTMAERHEVAADTCRISERVVLCAVEWDEGFRVSDHSAALGTEVKLRLLFVIVTLEFHISNHETTIQWVVSERVL